MNILNYLPGLLIVMFLAFNMSIVVRTLFEGADLKTALLSLFRLYFLPLGITLIIKGLLSKTEIRKKLEDIFGSKWRLYLFLFKISFSLYRPTIDVFIKASIKYEQVKKVKIKTRKVKKRQKTFYDFFIDDIDDMKVNEAILQMAH